MITSRILIKPTNQIPINLYLYIQFEVVMHREKKKGLEIGNNFSIEAVNWG